MADRDDESNPLKIEMERLSGNAPRELTSDARQTLTDALENGTANEAMMKYAARLLRDPLSSANHFAAASLWQRDMDKIRELFERGNLAQGYIELANQLRAGQADILFLKFAADVVEDVASHSNLPKRARLNSFHVSFAIGQMFEKAKEFGIRGEEKKRLLEDIFNMSFKSLEKEWSAYKRAVQEVEEIAQAELTKNRRGD